MRLLHLASIVTVIAVTGCGDDDGGAGTTDPARLSCAELQAGFPALMEGISRSCGKAEDCTMAGGTSSCHCDPTIGDCSGEPFNRSAYEGSAAQAWVDEFGRRCYTAGCMELTCICDCAPSSVDCVDGVCVHADPSGCPLSSSEVERQPAP